MELINTALIPSDYNVQDYLQQAQTQGMLPIDTTINNDLSNLIEEKINYLESTIQSLNLRIYVLEGRLSRKQADNLLEMLSSEDDASKYLAEKIINKFKDNEYSI